METEFKGTKGEWILTPETENDFGSVKIGDYEISGQIFFEYHGCESTEETNANLALISAAPELLKALQDITELFKRVEPLYSGDKRQIEKAEAAINKALGNN